MKEDRSEVLDIVRFHEDMTVRLSCREGDLFVWLSETLMSSSRKINVVDVWRLRGGESVLLTNRMVDLPPWLRLCPQEFAGKLAHQMVKLLNSGEYVPPDQPIDGPNLWRLKTGDRAVWMRSPRSWHMKRVKYLQLFDFVTCAVGIGESPSASLDQMFSFGSVQPNDESSVLNLRAAYSAVLQAGEPRNWSQIWAIES